MPLIVLDAGHGGANPGATYNGRKESEDVLALTLAVGSILEDGCLRVPVPESTGGKRGGRRLFCLDPSQFQSLSEPVQWRGESGLQPLRGGGPDGVQYQCQTGTGGVRESGSKREAESGGVKQHEYAGGAGGGWIYQYGCRQRTLRQPVR